MSDKDYNKMVEEILYFMYNIEDMTGFDLADLDTNWNMNETLPTVFHHLLDTLTLKESLTMSICHG